MPEAHHGDVTLHYLDQGSGAPVLLLHGHTFDRRVWDDVVPALLEAGLRLIRPDLRGHGLSTRTESGYLPSHHAADMAAVLDAAAVDAAVVVGFSLGGGVALEMALAQPDRLRALTLLAPTLPGRPFEPAFMDSLRQVARVARTEGIRAAMTGPWLDSPLFAYPFSKPGLRARVSDLVADFPGAEYLASERDRAEHEWTVPERLGEISVPTVVAVGERELPGFTAYAEAAAAGIPDARLERIPGCGHLLPFEAKDRVTELIVEVERRAE